MAVCPFRIPVLRSLSAPPMEKPRPRSPPMLRKKLPAEVRILDREIGSLKEKLQTLEGVQCVSRCCKEVHEFVASNPDPLILLNKKKNKSCFCWEWLRSKSCFNFSWICCSCVCSFQLKTPKCSTCNCGCRPRCPGCSCGCVWSCCPNCTAIRLCPKCTKNSCYNLCPC